MFKYYSLLALLFWVCSIASAQVMLPAYQGVFNTKEVTLPGAPINPIASSGYEEATVSFLAPTSNAVGYTPLSTKRIAIGGWSGGGISFRILKGV